MIIIRSFRTNLRSCKGENFLTKQLNVFGTSGSDNVHFLKWVTTQKTFFCNSANLMGKKQIMSGYIDSFGKIGAFFSRQRKNLILQQFE